MMPHYHLKVRIDNYIFGKARWDHLGDADTPEEFLFECYLKFKSNTNLNLFKDALPDFMSQDQKQIPPEELIKYVNSVKEIYDL